MLKYILWIILQTWIGGNALQLITLTLIPEWTARAEIIIFCLLLFLAISILIYLKGEKFLRAFRFHFIPLLAAFCIAFAAWFLLTLRFSDSSGITLFCQYVLHPFLFLSSLDNRGIIIFIAAGISAATLCNPISYSVLQHSHNSKQNSHKEHSQCGIN